MKISKNRAASSQHSGYTFSRHRLWIRPVSFWFSITTATLTVLSLILLSPLILRQAGIFKGVNWAELSNIGQTYGAASAILSGIALIGVSISLVIQAQQARADRIRAVRDRQTELLRIALDDPQTYAPVIGAHPDSTVDEVRRFYFTTMWMNYARFSFEMGTLTEGSLRGEHFPTMFRDASTRAWWEITSHYWTHDRELSRRDRRFARIAGEEYQKAVAAGPPSEVEIVDRKTANEQRSRQEFQWSSLASMILGLAIGLIIGSRTQSRH